MKKLQKIITKLNPILDKSTLRQLESITTAILSMRKKQDTKKKEKRDSFHL